MASLELPDVPPVWVRPRLVVEVEYRQRLRDGLRACGVEGSKAGQEAKPAPPLGADYGGPFY